MCESHVERNATPSTALRSTEQKVDIWRSDNVIWAAPYHMLTHKAYLSLEELEERAWMPTRAQVEAVQESRVTGSNKWHFPIRSR